jgi:hypothetical protein
MVHLESVPGHKVSEGRVFPYRKKNFSVAGKREKPCEGAHILKNGIIRDSD